MSPELMVALGGAIIVAITMVVVTFRKLPKRVKSVYYVQKWREIQKMCGIKDDWGHAIIHADMLLDEILLKKKFAGKTMGERLVSAQKKFSSHDAVWNAHKFANSLRENVEQKVSESRVKEALIAFRQALRDLGAL